TRERPVDPAAGNPAVTIVRPLKVERATAVEVAATDIVFVAGHRNAAAGIDEDVVKGISDPSRDAGKKIVIGLHERGLSRERQADQRAGLHGGARCGALDADDG